jgi:adenosylcobinamide amidohydrolase
LINFCFPGVTSDLGHDMLILRSEQPLHCLSLAIVGGGMVDTCIILNRHVDKGYDARDPVLEMHTLGRRHHIDAPFVGIMTAVRLEQAHAATLHEGDFVVAAVTTGTSTDAIVVVCTGRGALLSYAGPATPAGWLIGRCVRQAMEEALDAYRP